MKTPHRSQHRPDPFSKSTSKASRRLARLLACSIVGASATLSAGQGPAGLPSRAPRVLALAGEVALVGTERGLYRWSEEEGRWISLLAGAPIDDLAVGLGGEVWIAAEGDLYRSAPDLGAPLRVALPPGVGVRSIAIDPRGRTFVATEEGLFVAPAGGEIVRVSGAPLDPQAVRVAGADVWVAAGRALWVERPDGSFERQLAGLSEGGWELRGAAALDGVTWLAVPDGLWRIDASGPRLQPLSSPVIGAVGLASGLAAVTEDGLYCLAGRDADPRSVASAAVLSEAVSATSTAGRVAVLDASGVHTLACAAEAQAVAAAVPVALKLPPASEVVGLQRALLAQLDLEPARLRAVEARARRRARLPEVALSFSGDMARSRDHGRDQNVTTGRINDLVDAARSRDGGGQARLELTWELWRDAEPDAWIVISRERRELIELREQILDRFNRAYFELWRTRTRLSAVPVGSSERVDLEVRVRELAAVLDAWTGGAFSRADRTREVQP
jgi:hypothetical protein